MINLSLKVEQRPNKVTDQKNLDYHLRFARYCIGMVPGALYTKYITRSIVNWAFYRGYQWVFDEDMDAFLMDESGEVRNRIRFVENIIRPMVRMLKNNAIRIDYTYKAKAISPYAISRRDREMLSMTTLTEISNAVGGDMKELIKNNFPIGEDAGETQQIFEETYQDRLVPAINHLMSFVSEQNNMQRIKERCAEHLAVDGIAILREINKYNSQFFEVVMPQMFFWDRGAKEKTLHDGEYMGHIDMIMPITLYEQYEHLKDYEKEALEKYVKQKKFNDYQYLTRLSGVIDGRVPVCNVEWRDTERQVWGWVKEAGVEVFVQIDKKGSRFTPKDLIIPSDPTRRKELSKDKTIVRYPTVTRYCKFVPREYVVTGNFRDIVLEWGVLKYSDYDYLNPTHTPFSYKVTTFGYYEGEISSPLDDAIDPQRMINRINSMAESMLNLSRGAGMIYDKDNLDPEEGEEGMLRNVNLNKPVGLVNTGGNINNAIGKYDMTASPSVNIMFQAAAVYREAIKANSGINEAMTGTMGGQRELVGVTKNMIERGSLMQEDFYNMLGELFLQTYQTIAQRGKCLFIDNDYLIYYAVGDKYTGSLKLSKEYLNEYFKVFIKRTQSETDEQMTTNMLALQFLQLGLMDKGRFSQVFNVGNTEDVTRLMREYIKEVTYAEQQASQIQAQLAAGQDAMAQQNAQNQMASPIMKQQLANEGAMMTNLLNQKPQ